MLQTLTVILAGGQGERLFPLTKDRSKPSVPFAGSYRIIDFTLSNCINSGLRHIYVLTQYKSQSLNRHIQLGWNLLSRELLEFIDSVPPQKRTQSRWYEGTSDAIYQNIFLLEQHKPERTLVLSGDHIYRMDYRDLLDYHARKKADVTIGSFIFPREQANSFGVMHVNEEGRILNFIEKPADPPEMPGNPGFSLINMGIYVFNTACLVRAVIDDHKNASSNYDFGQNVIPQLVRDGSAAVYAYPFGGQSGAAYWRDVGSISSYYNASMDLLEGGSSIDIFSKEWPFRSVLLQLPPGQFNRSNNRDSQIIRSLICGGCRIDGSVSQCLISPGVTVGEGSRLDGCIVFNNSVIGRNCRIRKTIIDKDVVIPDECVIGFDPELDRQQFMVAEDQIAVIPRRMIVERMK